MNVDLKPCFEELRLMMQEMKPREDEIELRAREREMQKEELKEIVENTVRQHIKQIGSSKKEKPRKKESSPRGVKISDLK